MSSHDETDRTDYQRVPLERLRALATAGGDARTRAAAQREIDARAAAADGGAPALQAAVRVRNAEHGTPQPELIVTMPREAGARRLCALLHRIAAEVETALAATSEVWPVSLTQLDACTGTVYVELLYGTAPEVERATALLSSVLGRSTAGQPPGRKRDLKAERERRKAKLVEAVVPVAPAAPAAEGGTVLAAEPGEPPPSAATPEAAVAAAPPRRARA